MVLALISGDPRSPPPSSRCGQLRREEQAGLGEASGAEQDQYAFPLKSLSFRLAATPGQEAA